MLSNAENGGNECDSSEMPPKLSVEIIPEVNRKYTFLRPMKECLKHYALQNAFLGCHLVSWGVWSDHAVGVKTDSLEW